MKKKRYCASCDRVNGRKAAFCGSCGQSLDIVGTHIERFSFPIWSILIIVSFAFMPATLSFVALGYTYWAVEAFETMTDESPFPLKTVIFGSLLVYSMFYFFSLYQFGERMLIRIFSYVHIACAAVGIALSGYFTIQAMRALAGVMQPSHDVLQRATTEQLHTIAYYVLTHYAAFSLFYVAILFFSLRMMTWRSTRQQQVALQSVHE